MASSADLHKHCHNGRLKKVKELIEKLDGDALEKRLTRNLGALNYTPVHEAVAASKYEVLEYLLTKARDASKVVNARTSSGGYTPLHLAASCGSSEAVMILLRHKADISIRDDYGKTPKETAELSSKSRIVRLLRSEGNI